jgi:ubiquinone/menaquinone biosynthesis C-methylase UbiE
MANNKYHWYDGWFYDIIIAPNQDKLFEQVKNLIEPGSRVIDIGCGTGRLEFALADKCKSVLGIDLSKKNIDRANLTLLKHPDVKISFKHNNLSEIISNRNVHFDYAILTYVIHEVNEEEREDILRDVARIADKIIVGDYLVPRTKGFGSYFSETIEFIAGTEHYQNFKSYVASGGIYYLANKAGLKVIDEITNHPLSTHIVILAK